MTRALITGAGGFCGKYLLSYLHSCSVEVHTIGTKITSNNHHQVLHTDINAITSAIEESRPDYVFHLAGISNTTDVALLYSINTFYAANMLRGMELAGYGSCPVLLVGTAAEYGKIRDEDLPIIETTPANPYNHYGISKLAQTLMGVTLSKSGRPLVMMRPFNIIGPGMPGHISIQSFVQQIVDILRKRHAPVIDVGNLSSIRDFIDVNDVVKIYWDILQVPDAYGKVVNLCSGKGFKLEYVLNRLVTIAGIQVEIRFDPKRAKSGDVPICFGNPKTLQNILGYSPSENLDETLKLILNEALNR